jgi:hypothetical protein
VPLAHEASKGYESFLTRRAESFLSASDEASLHWRQQFIRTFLIYPGEKDYTLDDRIQVPALRNVEGPRDAVGGVGRQ